MHKNDLKKANNFETGFFHLVRNLFQPAIRATGKRTGARRASIFRSWRTVLTVGGGGGSCELFPTANVATSLQASRRDQVSPRKWGEQNLKGVIRAHFCTHHFFKSRASMGRPTKRGELAMVLRWTVPRRISPDDHALLLCCQTLSDHRLPRRGCGNCPSVIHSTTMPNSLLFLLSPHTPTHSNPTRALPVKLTSHVHSCTIR